MSNQMLEMYESDKRALQDHTYALQTHARVMAAHCECLAMNAENMWAAIANKDPVYLEGSYHKIMQKWGLIDSEGKPLV